MIATLVILLSLFRDFRWPRKKTTEEAEVKEVEEVAEVTTPKTTSLNLTLRPHPHKDRTELKQRRVVQLGNCHEMNRTAVEDSSGDEEENHSDTPRAVPDDNDRMEKRPSIASSSASTSASTEQTQIDATLGSTSSGTTTTTLPSASSPLTPGAALAAGVTSQLLAHQQQLSLQQQNSNNVSSNSNSEANLGNTATTNSSSTTVNNSVTNNNLRGARHEHRLMSNSSTDTISAMNNLSSHSESYCPPTNSGTNNTTTGSGHSGGGVITYPFKIRGDSTASTISTSACSEVLLPPDGRRSSEGARLMGHRRSSGRIRRYVPRTTISSGGRRRTTGRYLAIDLISRVPVLCCVGVGVLSCQCTLFVPFLLHSIRTLN